MELPSRKKSAGGRRRLRGGGCPGSRDVRDLGKKRQETPSARRYLGPRISSRGNEPHLPGLPAVRGAFPSLGHRRLRRGFRNPSVEKTGRGFLPGGLARLFPQRDTPDLRIWKRGSRGIDVPSRGGRNRLHSGRRGGTRKEGRSCQKSAGRFPCRVRTRSQGSSNPDSGVRGETFPGDRGDPCADTAHVPASPVRLPAPAAPP